MPDEDDALSNARLARSYLASSRYLGTQALWWWNGSFWRWRPEHPVYQQLGFDEQAHEVLNWLIRQEISASYRTAEAVTHCVSALATLPRHIKQPSWIGGARSRHEWYIAMKNRLVDPLGLVAGDARMVQKHTPQWFSQTILPYPYDRKALCPHFQEWLLQMMDGHTDRCDVVQEFFGYWLIPDTSRQLSLFLVGPSGTGKSTLLNVAKNLIGVTNCSFIGLSDLGKRFSLSPMVGKLLNISDEARDGKLGRDAEAVFKWLVGGAEMSLEDKNIRYWTQKLQTRQVVALNAWPEFTDTAGATYRRIRVVPMQHKIGDYKYDPGVETRLLEELPGIFNWAILGLKRVLATGMSRCRAGELVLEQCRQRNQPTIEFTKDRIEPDETGFVSNATLVQSYRSWLEDQGQRGTADATELFSAIQQRVPGARAGRPRTANKAGERPRGVFGIKLV